MIIDSLNDLSLTKTGTLIMEKETTRVEAFSDGVFAIALTLLIFTIKVPDLDALVTKEKLYLALVKLWPSYLAFLMSFAAVLIMWINHHGFFKYLRKINTAFLFANGFLLLTVTFINFPTSVLAQYFETPAVNIAAAFYCGALLMINISYNLLWFSSAFKRRLVKEEISDALIIKIRNAYWLGFFVYLAAFAISFYLPYVGLLMSIFFWVYWVALNYDRNHEKNKIRQR
jgi:uncharacterized membrane protein